MPSTLDAPFCTQDNVTQRVSWGECENPGTLQSKCANKEEVITVEVCIDACDSGRCVAYAVSTTTTSTSTTSTEPTTTTTTEPTTTTTTTIRPYTPTTSTTQTTLLQRTNTKLDRIIEIIESLLWFLLSWK